MRTIVIGQAPSADGFDNFEGRSGRRLADLCGVSHREFLDVFERVNLLAAYPGPARNGKGDAFPAGAARVAADAMRPRLTGRRVILIGNGVAAAFRKRAALFVPILGLATTYLIAPHPSGVSRWWNEPGADERARRFWSTEFRISRGPG